MRPQTRSEIAGLLDEHGVRPRRSLGQHFLADGNVITKIVSIAEVGDGDKVVEVGAGTGTLTRALAATGAHVVAYEVDERLRPILESVTAGYRVDLRFDDVTGVDLGTALEGDDWIMVANLPYNVGTPLIMDVLRHVPRVRRLVVMIQREVAARLVADVGTPEYGLPSVVTRIHAEASLAFSVPPQVFYPAPRVQSAVLVMSRRPAPDRSERAVELARAAFGQRRKMIRGSLGRIMTDPGAALARSGIEPTARAEDLSADDYLRLAAAES